MSISEGITLEFNEGFSGPPPQELFPQGIASSEAWGTPSVAVQTKVVAPAGIASAEAWGTPSVATQTKLLNPPGIASSEAWGTPSVNTSTIKLNPAGITSSEIWGTPSLAVQTVRVHPASIPPAPEQPIFTRATNAFLDGVEVSANTPRYPSGDSILIEEGTTNTITNTDWTSWLDYSSGTPTGTTSATTGVQTIERTGGTGRLGRRQTISGLSGKTYTAQVEVRVVSTDATAIGMLYVDAQATLDADGTSTLITASKTLDLDTLPIGAWVRQTVSITSTDKTLSGGGTAYIWLDSGVAKVEWRWAQVEAKSYATSWHPGGATRNNEGAELPIGMLPPTEQEGTLELDVFVTQRLKDRASINQPNFFNSRTSTNGVVYLVRLDPTTLTFYVAQAGTSLGLDALPLGICRIVMKWGSFGVRGWVNGTEVASTLTVPEARIPANAFLASFNTGSGHLGEAVDGLRVSDRARTDAELAGWEAELVADEATTYLLSFENSLQAIDYNFEYTWGTPEVDKQPQFELYPPIDFRRPTLETIVTRPATSTTTILPEMMVVVQRPELTVTTTVRRDQLGRPLEDFTTT